MKLTIVIVSAFSCFLANCVQGRRAKINGGPKAEVGEFKYIVGIVNKPGFFTDPSYCTGSIINPKFILTAAHCFTEDNGKNADGTDRQEFVNSKVIVYANVIGLDKQYRKRTSAIKRKGVSVYFPPEYLEKGLADIAILELDRALSLHGGLLEQLQRPGPSNVGYYPSRPSLYEKAQGVLAGYGKDKVGNDNNKLKWINMNVVSFDKCRVYQDYRSLNEQKFVCGEGREAPFSGCQGDSGAPLVVTDSSVPPKKTVIGVLSRGGSCSEKKNNPNVFIRVSEYKEFIFNVINKYDSPSTVEKYELKHADADCPRPVLR